MPLCSPLAYSASGPRLGLRSITASCHGWRRCSRTCRRWVTSHRRPSSARRSRCSRVRRTRRPSGDGSYGPSLPPTRSRSRPGARWRASGASSCRQTCTAPSTHCAWKATSLRPKHTSHRPFSSASPRRAAGGTDALKAFQQRKPAGREAMWTLPRWCQTRRLLPAGPTAGTAWTSKLGWPSGVANRCLLAEVAPTRRRALLPP